MSHTVFGSGSDDGKRREAPHGYSLRYIIGTCTRGKEPPFFCKKKLLAPQVEFMNEAKEMLRECVCVRRETHRQRGGVKISKGA